jgi:hypothetical protein
MAHHIASGKTNNGMARGKYRCWHGVASYVFGNLSAKWLMAQWHGGGAHQRNKQRMVSAYGGA